MSNDLISREALMVAINTDFYEHFTAHHDSDQTALIDMVMQDIEEIPTAYDVDAVREELEEELRLADKEKERCIKENQLQFDSAKGYSNGIANAIEIVRNGGKKDNDGWIACSDRMPECEQEVYILTERGTKTTALYEDGKMPESKSKWYWNDIQGEWDEEEDCMIIPEGWWEYRHFNPDDVYNNVVDEKVISWHPLPEPYKPPVESADSKRMMEREELFEDGEQI